MPKRSKAKKVDSLREFQKEVEKIILNGLEKEECIMRLEYVKIMALQISSKAIDYAGEFHSEIMREA